MKRLLPVLLLCACAHGQLDLVVFDERTGNQASADPLPAEVLAACEVLELECTPSPDMHGVVVLVLLPPDSAIHGRELQDAGCRRIAWSDPENPLTIAHEIGHVLGLDHVKDERNLMWPYAKRPGLSEKQHQRIAHSVTELQGCLP